MKIDHVELFVPDKWEAARWYGRVFGHEVIEAHLDWAEGTGPLMTTNDGGATMLALFDGPPQGDAEVCGLRRIAFRVGGEELVRFVEESAAWRGEPLGRADLQDHGKAVSVYFKDPWGTLLEVTTYEPGPARAALLG